MLSQSPVPVTVVIPCFRQAHLLSEAIESALTQSYAHVQVVVVNDGSDDDTDAVAARYRNQIRYVAKPNGGVCSARNAGIAIADGRYLLFLDADDLLHPNAVEWLVKCTDGRDDRLALMGFRSFSEDPWTHTAEDLLPAAGASWFAKTFDIDPLLARRPAGLDPARLAALPYLIYTNFGPPHCWLSSRKMIIEVGSFDESLRGCGDWDLWLRLALAGAQLTTSENAGALYRRYEGSMSSDIAHMLDDRTKVLLKTIDALRTDRRALAQWRTHLLQAARRVRRRYCAFGIRSGRVRELTAEIRFLQTVDEPLSRRFADTIVELVLGARWDPIALAHYRHSRPDLASYYRADTD